MTGRHIRSELIFNYYRECNAVAAAVSGAFSLSQAGVQFVVVSVGGIALGLAAGRELNFVHRWLDSPPLEITVTLLTPFAVYLLGEEVLRVSGILATVTTGLYLTCPQLLFL